MASHRARRRPSPGVLSVLFVLTALGFIAAAAPADASPTHQARFSRAATVAVPTLNQGESARFTLIDNGSSLTVFGTADNMRTDTFYDSLFYPDPRCSTPDGQTSTLAGSWQPRGARHQTLLVSVVGDAYRTLKAAGAPASESIRAQVSAANVGNGVFLIGEQARACASYSS